LLAKNEKEASVLVLQGQVFMLAGSNPPVAFAWPRIVKFVEREDKKACCRAGETLFACVKCVYTSSEAEVVGFRTGAE